MTERRRVSDGAGRRAGTRRQAPAERAERAERAEPETLDEERADLEDYELADEPEVAGEPARDRSGMTAGEAARAALRQIAQLTAKQPEGVTEVERTEDGWTVGIELVEDRRIPSSADILATYETTIGTDGELLSYRRIRRYARGRADAEEL